MKYWKEFLFGFLIGNFIIQTIHIHVDHKTMALHKELNKLYEDEVKVADSFSNEYRERCLKAVNLAVFYRDKCDSLIKINKK